jgi:hypothetical protein
MNLWKPLAIVSTSAFVFVIGYQAASAGSAGSGTTVIADNKQPNMETALTKLKEARAALDKAEHNKGGWRANAVIATDLAISETKRGIEFANAAK